MLELPLPPFIRIAVAPASVALVIGAKLAVDPVFGDASPSPYLLITAAVLISALVGGFWPGMLATVLVAGAVDYLFLEPKYSFAGHSSGQYAQLVVFMAEGTAVSAAGAIARASIRERARLFARESEIRSVAEDGRRRYRELVEGLGVALYTTDAAGRITSFNDAAAELWGRRPELNSDEWCGSWRLYYPDGRPMPHEECPMAVTLKEGQPVRGVEAIAERPDGTRVNFIPVPSLLRSASGELTGAVNVLVDITDRKRAEEARQEAEEKYRNIFENAVFGVFQTTRDGQFLSANEALAQMLGYDSAEELITTVTDIGQQVHADPERRAEFVRLLDEQGTVSGFTAHACRKDGQVIWLSLSGRALRDADGRATGFEGIAEDTTVRTEAEELVARLLTMEQTARLEAEVGEQRLRFLSEASGALAASLEEGFVLERVAKLAVPGLADLCEIHTFNAEGESVEMAIACADPALEEIVTAICAAYTPPQSRAHPLFRVLKRLGSLLISDVHGPALLSLAQDEAQRELLEKLGPTSYMAIPLLSGGRPVGAMTFTAVDPQRRFGQAELAIVEILGRRVSMAMENAKLYAESQQTHENLRTAVERQQFLARAGGVLASSLDFDATIEGAVELALPSIADCCVVHIFPTAESPARAAVAHVNPAHRGLMRQLIERYPPRPGDGHPIIQMMETNRAVLVEEVAAEAMQGIGQDDARQALLDELGFNSYMVVPLNARGKLFGAMTFAVATPMKRYSQEDMDLAQELATRVALALDNAGLYTSSRETQEELRAANEAKNEFLGVMSHELRTPITAITGGVRLLRSRADTMDAETQTEILSDMEAEADRMYRMVENLLTLGRLELGQELETEPVLAQRILPRIAASFMKRKPGRNVEVDADEQLEAIAAVPAYLELALRNLLSNADKYSPAGQPIELVARQSGEELEIAVLDRGPGVHPDEAEAIFERFYRSERTSGSRAGIGLGLTVCKRMMEAQGGQVWMRPRDGGGSEIGLTLNVYKNGVE